MLPQPPATQSPHPVGPLPQQPNLHPQPVLRALPPLPSELTSLGSPQLHGEVDRVDLMRESMPIEWEWNALIVMVKIIFLPVQIALAFVAHGRLGSLFSLSGHGRHNRREDRPVFIVTVNKNDNTQEQARIEGELEGAMMSQGDDIALWGPYRHGVLVAKRGYDYTYQAQIRLRVDHGRLARRVIAIGVFCWFALIAASVLNPFQVNGANATVHVVGSLLQSMFVLAIIVFGIYYMVFRRR